MKFAIQSQKESALIAEILAGDLQLYHQLIRPYERYVYIMTLSCLSSESEAEEAAQETFVRAFRNLRRLPGDASFGAWLFGIVRDEAGKRSSRRESEQIVPANESQDEDVPMSPAILSDWPELASDAVECEETRSLLRHAVERLPCVCRRVFFLRDVEGLNVSEAAQLLDMNTSQVKAALHRARIMLQRLLAPKLTLH
jgi:RNA polymerase sigma-70 factor, ECF subfamily